MSTPHPENLRCIGFMVLSMAGFAIEDAVIKYLALSMPISQVLMLIGFGGMVSFALLSRFQREALIRPDVFKRWFVIRTICELGSAILFVTAIVHASLSASSAILQATPLAVALGGVLVLKQTVSISQWGLISLGFFGVLLVIGPGTDAFQPATLFAVGGVVFLAVRDLITRVISVSMPAVVVSFWAFFALFMSGVVTIPLFGAFTPIEWIHVGILILSAVAGSIGYYSVVLATRDGDVAVIAPFRYTRLVFAMILAVLIFDEQITPLMIAGSLLIIISGIGVLGFTWPARQRVP